MYNITNSTQADQILINMSSQIPLMFPMLLFFEFMVIAIGGSFSNQRRIGYTNIPMWSAIAGLVTSTTAFILFMVDGIISIVTLSIVVAVTLGCVSWFFFSGDEQ